MNAVVDPGVGTLVLTAAVFTAGVLTAVGQLVAGRVRRCRTPRPAGRHRASNP